MERLSFDLTNADQVPSISSDLGGVTEDFQSIEIGEHHQQGEILTESESDNTFASYQQIRYARPSLEGIRSRTVSPEPTTPSAKRVQDPGQAALQGSEVAGHSPLRKSTEKRNVTWESSRLRNNKRSLSLSSQSEDDSSFNQSPKRQKATTLWDENTTKYDESSDEDEGISMNEARRDVSRRAMFRPTSDEAAESSQFQRIVIEDDDGESILVEDDEGSNFADDAVYSSPHQLLIDDDDIQLISSISRYSDRSVAGSKIIEKIKKNGITCASDKNVELYNGDFMRIVTMTENQDGDIRIIGHLFRRHNKLECSKWPRRSNELVLISVTTKHQPVELTTVSLADVRRNRHLILTNNVFPFDSLKDHPDAFRSAKVNREYGPLFCRWKHHQVMNDQGKLIEESIEKLSFAEADDDYRKVEADIRREWRSLDTESREDRPSDTSGRRKSGMPSGKMQYTFGDAFCGAGGASCAADEAGLSVKWGIDFSEPAMQTYASNFLSKGTDCLHQEIHGFIIQARIQKRCVDILHISPPCQPYSPAHTVPNLVQDERNQATLFSVGDLLETIKPRVVTLEETFGLLNRHKRWFNALIKMFLDKNYSVRWTSACLEKYGLPQKRRRLLIFAAAPGEALPPFPKATHGYDDTARPFNTIHSTIKDIPVTATHHNVNAAAFPPGQCRPPFDPNILARTITTSGGQDNYHPSGKRNYTSREFASLQCFPVSYKFADVGVTAQRRQIGNAVPPFVFKKFYREIIKSLRETDRLA